MFAVNLLATTGVDTSGYFITAGVLVVGGIVLVLIRRLTARPQRKIDNGGTPQGQTPSNES
ncbi:LPXTG-motif cell wall-anchored protein [Microbacteriaceae bacterium MWH-Ta3]|nr:LPXTG-motif cell wall-anchored protein [Microbacteriaceae bacterium MWH-Ta3]